MQVLHREGHDLNALFKVGDAGLEIFFPKLFSVYTGFEHTDACGVQSRYFQAGFHGETLSYHRVAAVALFGGDPLGLPGLIHLSCLKAALCFGGISGIAGDTDAYQVGCAGF